MAETAPATPPRFVERPREAIVRDAWRFALVPAAAAMAAGALGWWWAAGAFALLAGFVPFFFRNPKREGPDEPGAVLAPADGHVLEVGEIEESDGRKRLRIGIFLSVFDVHVNRMPVSGTVESVERSGSRYRAAFRADAETQNVRCAVTLRTSEGAAVTVVQIVGLVARRIVCHPRPGEWVERGMRYGLIRFGSRTDVVLPLGAEARVRKGQRVHGGHTVVAWLREGMR